MSFRSVVPPKSVEPALEPLLAGFLDWARVERGFSGETISTYRRCLERFFTEATVLDVEQITASDVTSFKRTLLNRECSPSYIAGMLLALKSFLHYCGEVRQLRVLAPDTIKPPVRPRRTVTYLTPDEVKRFVGSIKLHNRWAGRVRRPNTNQSGLLYRALVEVLLGTGLRISEALALRRQDVDWTQREARVVGKGRKERTVFFTDRALHWLKVYLENGRGHQDPDRCFVDLDGGPLSRIIVGRWFRRQRIRAGIGKTVTAHVLRHTVATTLMFNGCPMGHIKEILGHERLETTCRYYLGLDLRRARKAHRDYLTYDCAENGTS